MNNLTPDRRELLDRLRAISDQIDGHESTLHVLKIEQLRTRSALARSGYRAPAEREGLE